MKKPRFTPHIFIIAAVIVLGSFSVFGQAAAATDQSYGATLHVVIGSDESSHRSDLPKSLEGVEKQIRGSFSFKNYHLLNTYYGRLADGGSLEHKSVSSLKDAATGLDSPSFLDWQLANFRAEPSQGGKGALSVQIFRFGARVPILVARIGSEGPTVPVRNYEPVGLTLNKLTVSSNLPTLIGTISLPRATGTLFLVVAIKPV